MTPLNVLITAASRRVPLVQAFRRALSDLRVPGRVVVTDVNRLSPAVRVADRAYRVSLSSSPTYLDEIVELCRREHIGLVVPTIDDELVAFGSARARLAALGAQVAVSEPATTAICNDKHATSGRLRASGIAAAASYLPGSLPPTAAFPLFVKPRVGRGGVGAFAAADARELEFFCSYVADPVIQEFLDGPEYTIDLLCDFAGTPLSVVPRERVVIRAGVIDRGRTTNDPALVDLALRCATVLRFVGAVNIQCRMVRGRPVVFEINPRFSGGIPLTIAAGADFPRMLAELALGRRVAPAIGGFTAGLWMSSFEASFFFHDDDDALHALDAWTPAREVA